ncbi:cytochrome P450 4C1-like isoform X1 [Vespula squamosa]|uniref:Cytochrome P450 4C1-like isoform X1 n=1 Tax=Vespula squamosa TaxID=30214 RepID=A0ABD2BH76_VESSQ
MKLLERVIKETLLFPAGPVTARKVTQDIKGISGYKIITIIFFIVNRISTLFGRSSAIFFIYNLHHNEKYWPRPLVFDPDRFLPRKNSSSNFFPFSYNRRNCIEMTIIATLIRKFRIKIDKPIGIVEIGVKLNITLKPIE